MLFKFSFFTVLLQLLYRPVGLRGGNFGRNQIKLTRQHTKAMFVPVVKLASSRSLDDRCEQNFYERG